MKSKVFLFPSSLLFGYCLPEADNIATAEYGVFVGSVFSDTVTDSAKKGLECKATMGGSCLPAMFLTFLPWPTQS